METTHKNRDGRYVQIVSPERLREILLADGETLSRPDHFGDDDEWDVGEDDDEPASPDEIEITLGRDNVPVGDRSGFADAVLVAVREAHPLACVSLRWDVEQDIETGDNDPTINQAIETLVENTWDQYCK